jgi:hypothetical protein
LNGTLAQFERDLNKYNNNTNNNNNKLVNDAVRELFSIKYALNESFASLQAFNQLEKEKNSYLQIVQQIDMIEQTRFEKFILKFFYKY